MIKRRNELKERYNLLLNAIYLKTDNNTNIAKKFDVSTSRVSQIKKTLNQLKYKPELVDGKIKCQICDKQKGLVIHHNNKTGETIAILCHSCNVKVGDNDELIYSNTEGIKIMIRIYTLLELEGALSVNLIVKKLKQQERYGKVNYYVKKLLEEKRIISIGKLGRNRQIYCITECLTKIIEIIDKRDFKSNDKKILMNYLMSLYVVNL